MLVFENICPPNLPSIRKESVQCLYLNELLMPPPHGFSPDPKGVGGASDGSGAPSPGSIIIFPLASRAGSIAIICKGSLPTISCRYANEPQSWASEPRSMLGWPPK